MSYETITIDVEDEIATITLNRPDKLNAFSVTMAGELQQAFNTASEDHGVRAVIVTGAGKAFCAGMDLSREGNVFGLDETHEERLPSLFDLPIDSEELAGVRDLGGQLALSILNCRKPVIGAINGAAVGIGATMTLSMDARIASDQARFGFVFGRIGIVPEACSTWLLPRIVGLPRALEWMYAADIFDAQEALQGGLVREVAAADALMKSARHLADRFTRNRSRVGTALTKQMLLHNPTQPNPMMAHKIESLSMFYASIGDGKEGVRAFLEKRAPTFDTNRPMPPFYQWWRNGGDR
jgi:enoyl-CoA hydratase/carnithine racemase